MKKPKLRSSSTRETLGQPILLLPVTMCLHHRRELTEHLELLLNTRAGLEETSAAQESDMADT